MVVENDGAEINTMKDNTLEALEQGTLTLGELQRSAINICRFIMATPAMVRPLKAYSPINTFAAQTNSGDVVATRLEEGIDLNTKINKIVTMEVVEAGVYQFTSSVRYDRHSLAQSSCSLSLNGIFAMSLSVNGTDGERVTVEGLKVRLEKGFYELTVDFLKRGLELERLMFTKD
jgi:beta-glucosidase